MRFVCGDLSSLLLIPIPVFLSGSVFATLWRRGYLRVVVGLAYTFAFKFCRSFLAWVKDCHFFRLAMIVVSNCRALSEVIFNKSVPCVMKVDGDRVISLWTETWVISS